MIKQKPLTKLQINVLSMLQESTRLTRAQIQDGIYSTVNNPNHDRRIRGAIATLRNRGYVISSSSRGKGYQLTTDPAKVRHYVNEQVKKAKSLMRTAHKVKCAYGLRDQMPLSGYLGKVTENG